MWGEGVGGGGGGGGVNLQRAAQVPWHAMATRSKNMEIFSSRPWHFNTAGEHDEPGSFRAKGTPWCPRRDAGCRF